MSSSNTIPFSAVPVAMAVVNRSSADGLAGVLRRDVDAACEEARRRGFDEAMEMLNRQILDQRSEIAQLQDATFRAVADLHEALVAQAKQVLPALALEIAKRTLAGIEPDRKMVAGIAAETLAEISPGSTGVEIWLSPTDFKLATGLQEEFSQTYPGIRIQEDPELLSGDCRARSRFGAIDARISTKLDNVARSFS